MVPTLVCALSFAPMAACELEDATPNLSDMVRRIDRAMVEIRAFHDTAGRTVESGAGAIVGDGRTVITCWHVVRRGVRLEVHTHDGERHPAWVVKRFPRHDLAVLAVDCEQRYPTFRLDFTRKLESDIRVYLPGFPNDGRLRVEEGVVEANDARVGFPYVDPQVPLIRFRGRVDGGFSGGPMLDAEGRVLGVVAGVSRQQAGVGYAVGLDPLVGVIVSGDHDKRDAGPTYASTAGPTAGRTSGLPSGSTSGSTTGSRGSSSDPGPMVGPTEAPQSGRSDSGSRSGPEVSATPVAPSGPVETRWDRRPAGHGHDLWQRLGISFGPTVRLVSETGARLDGLAIANVQATSASRALGWKSGDTLLVLQGRQIRRHEDATEALTNSALLVSYVLLREGRLVMGTVALPAETAPAPPRRGPLPAH